jgi:hypothetical protein
MVLPITSTANQCSLSTFNTNFHSEATLILDSGSRSRAASVPSRDADDPRRTRGELRKVLQRAWIQTVGDWKCLKTGQMALLPDKIGDVKKRCSHVGKQIHIQTWCMLCSTMAR